MPSGRLSKRPGELAQTPQDSFPGASKVKLPRLERGPEDFSQVVKDKLQSYTRTGQACDRCKQSLECYVTDRVTGRTERRGYLQQLEREKKDMMNRLRDMEKLLEDKGVQVRPWQWTPPYGLSAPLATDNDPSKDQWTQFFSLWVKDSNRPSECSWNGYPSALQASSLQAADPKTADARLGVAAESTPLSSINGTQLSILGTTIDITSFSAPDVDGPPPGVPNNTPLYNKSLRSFINSVSKVNPPLQAHLPARDEAFSYSEWFFVMLGPFMPVLHKPTYLRLLSRIYDDQTYKASTAELAIVHMVFAIMYYQFSVRDSEDPDRKAQLNELSNRHYHWCLDKTWDLGCDMSIPSTQALVLMLTHCRGFPKPGPVYLMATLAWTRAMDMNLHRAFLDNDEPTTLENEMRKRLWWSIFMVVVILYGRIGKPMPIRADDFDTELPICIPDECIDETGITDPDRIGECYWLVGHAGFKLSFLFMELWNNVYSVRQDPNKYMASVRRLEHQFRDYERELPEELQVDKCKPQNQMLASYLAGSNHEFLFCLRHPSRCISTNPNLVAENSKISEDSARGLLRVASELSRLKSLDTTWYQLAVYVAAMFTILAAHWERRFDMTLTDLASLRADINMGLSVIMEVSKHIGIGMANPSYYNPAMTTPTTAYPQMGYTDLTQSALSTPTTASSSMQSSYIPAVAEESAHHQYLYATSAAASAAAVQMTHTPPGNSPQAVTAAHNPMVAYNNPQQTAGAQTHHSQQQAPTGWMSGGPGAANGMPTVQHVPNGANPWHEWASAITMGVPPSSQDRYSANALLTLGSEQRGPGGPGGGGGGAGPHATVPVNAHGGQWSMMMTYPNPNHTGG
ncbi:putative transcription factor [Diaporthe ampelina]|uniref:Putative transcription factor n=1 Tax=Diaporthe ampelina TaxID=1214573 RepID=A0A0G2H6J4_9PEZI|nr:putative transcription factor [Diaporthe ampelina]